MFLQCENEALPTEVNNPKTYFETIDPSIALNEILTSAVGEKKEPSVFKAINLDKEAKKMVYESGEVSYTFALTNADVIEKTDNVVYTVENLSVQLNDDGSYTSYIFRYTPDMVWFNNPNNEFGSYTGEIQMLDVDLQILNISNLVEGELITNKTLDNSSPTNSKSCFTTITVEFWCNSNEYVEDCGWNYIINTMCAGDGGGGNGDGGTGNGNNGNGDGGDGGSGTSGTGGKEVKTNPILGTCHETNTCEQIDTTALEGKEKCAYEALVNTNGDLFNETIGTFGVAGSSYNLTFIYGSCASSGGEACTDPSDLANYNLTIKIADVGLSVLEQAANLLHEGIHAEIYRYVNENGGNVDPNDRINLYTHYKDEKVQDGSVANTAIAQHQHMADRYVYPIARAIRELDGFRFPVESYLPFGWSGLSAYGIDGYYNENIEFVYFDDDNFEVRLQEIVDSTSVGNNCDNDD